MAKENEITLETHGDVTLFDIRGDVTIFSEPFLNDAYENANNQCKNSFTVNPFLFHKLRFRISSVINRNDSDLLTNV